jgi:hypothetical protein
MADRRQNYVRQVLALYVDTPGVLGRIRRADRELAGSLFDRSVPLYAFATPRPPVRSLHYFLQPIREVIERPPGPRDIDALRQILADHRRVR